jgi:hypothetical protein
MSRSGQTWLSSFPLRHPSINILQSLSAKSGIVCDIWFGGIQCDSPDSHCAQKLIFPRLVFAHDEPNRSRKINLTMTSTHGAPRDGWNRGRARKSDTDTVALISWNDLDKIEYRSLNKTENELGKMEIHIRLRYHPGKVGYSRVRPKRKARRTQMRLNSALSAIGDKRIQAQGQNTWLNQRAIQGLNWMGNNINRMTSDSMWHCPKVGFRYCSTKSFMRGTKFWFHKVGRNAGFMVEFTIRMQRNSECGRIVNVSGHNMGDFCGSERWKFSNSLHFTRPDMISNPNAKTDAVSEVCCFYSAFTIDPNI